MNNVKTAACALLAALGAQLCEPACAQVVVHESAGEYRESTDPNLLDLIRAAGEGLERAGLLSDAARKVRESAALDERVFKIKTRTTSNSVCRRTTIAYPDLSRIGRRAVWIYVNADSPAELKFAAAQYRTLEARETARSSFAPIKIVLAAGSPTAASQKLGLRVYADVDGRLAERLSIDGTPAVVEFGPSSAVVFEHTVNERGESICPQASPDNHSFEVKQHDHLK